MESFLAIAGALADENRVRALAALRDGELCLCQLTEVLGLAPSTVSRHMDLLFRAGLVRRRKEGRWHYFRLAGADAPAVARQALRWSLGAVKEEAVVRSDARRLCCVRGKDREEAGACHRTS